MCEDVELEWSRFPGGEVRCLGLIDGGESGDLRRLKGIDGFPEGVRKQAECPSGVRLCCSV